MKISWPKLASSHFRGATCRDTNLLGFGQQLRADQGDIKITHLHRIKRCTRRNSELCFRGCSDTSYCTTLNNCLYVVVPRGMDCEVKPITPMSPNLQAHVERVIQTIKHEVLNGFCLVSNSHLDHILRLTQSWYSERRCHSARDNLPPVRTLAPSEPIE